MINCFRGQLALVTGGGSGIGRSVALARGEAGASVIVADHDIGAKVDIVTSTFGKALGGAMGGFISSGKEVTEDLSRNHGCIRSQMHLLPPSVGQPQPLSISPRALKATHSVSGFSRIPSSFGAASPT